MYYVVSKSTIKSIYISNNKEFTEIIFFFYFFFLPSQKFTHLYLKEYLAF